MSSAAMENFVMNVRTLSTQGNFNELNEFLQKNMELLVRNPAHLGTVLETLDFQQHSLGVLAVMSAKLQVKTIFIIINVLLITRVLEAVGQNAERAIPHIGHKIWSQEEKV